MQCHLNGVQISEVSKFLAKNASETTHATELINPFDAIHPLIILLQLSGVTSYFDVYSSGVAEYEDKDIPKIHFTAEEPPWDPLTNEYSKRETCMLDHQGQIRIPATASKGPIYVSTVVLHSLVYDATVVMDNGNLGIALESQIQICIVLIGMIRTPSIEPIVSSKRWDITPEKAQKTIQDTLQRWIRTMLHPLLSTQIRTNDRNLCYHDLEHPVFLDTMFASAVSRRCNRCAQVYTTDFGWARAFLMASRNEAHETLSLLFARDGVPQLVYVTTQKNDTRYVSSKAHRCCNLKQLEPYTPWSNDQRERNRGA